ncbi:hypothetical protein CRE_12759 [Caenorhabditis remanei]|uniref:C2H2-type domain-containing protein n=1 Tax=Caenorhabditis remanei TaxID=31234 RepID=E3M7N3_CAERE|nr:hypothetical protein CRE_12759 [Caenorhabditis remanei]
MVRYKCNECLKTFDLKRYLTKHELRMHKNKSRSEESKRSVEPLKCSMCDKVFPRLSHLQRHQMTHLNVRDYSCDYCDEKFVQKAHLTRHLSRKHSNESGVEVNWIACDKCGNLFKTTYEMKIHRRTVHELHRCKRCREIIESGNDGLRQHYIRCRDREKMCEHCGASFSRKADLTAHQTSCLKKVAFVCIPCESFFKQRVEVESSSVNSVSTLFQLDRHIKKLHFRSVKCEKCEHISESPVQHSRHSLECLKINICGYCNVENPDKDHVAEFHWKRLKRAVPRRVAEKMIKKKEMVPSTSDCVVKTEEDSEEVEEDFEESTSGQMETEVEPDGNQEMKKRDSKEFDDPLFNFSEASTSQLDFCSTAFTEEDDSPEEYLTFSICPNDTDLSFHLRGRLPEQLVSLFPELENTSIILLNSVALPRCRMTVRVPVTIPKSCDNEMEMRKWLGKSINLQED